jgi:hypothetical protein
MVGKDDVWSPWQRVFESPIFCAAIFALPYEGLREVISNAPGLGERDPLQTQVAVIAGSLDKNLACIAIK